MSASLQELLASIGHHCIYGPRDQIIHRIVHNSRIVKSGDLFVAIKGLHHDGHEHIAEAVQKGAVAIVGERLAPERPANVTYITVRDGRKALADLACAFYDHPTKRVFTVGVTGTKGKTSVTHMIAAVLGLEETETISTITNALRRGLDQTTPEAPEIQRIAQDALRSGKKHLVIEVSAHALSQERVRGVDFDVTVFTNLSHDHLDYYGDFEAYLQAKLKLFRSLGPGGMAMVNRDDCMAERVIEAACASGASIYTYGLNPSANIWAEEIELGPNGSRALIHTPEGSTRINLHLPGIFYIQNALAAIGVGLLCGVALSLIGERLEAVRHIEGRLERFVAPQGFTIVIDFAHSPDSLEKTIQTLRPFHRRVITVFGCGGDSDRLKRPLMGAISGCLSDYTILTSDNPKSEDPQMILREIEAGLKALPVPYEAMVERPKAIQRALELAHPGDCVLIAGKGHERTQIFKNHQIPFNDKEFLKELGVIAA